MCWILSNPKYNKLSAFSFSSHCSWWALQKAVPEGSWTNKEFHRKDRLFCLQEKLRGGISANDLLWLQLPHHCLPSILIPVSSRGAGCGGNKREVAGCKNHFG